jgi:hypothetical protein
MAVLLLACWCMAVPKSFGVLLVLKSLCGVANANGIFDFCAPSYPHCKLKGSPPKMPSSPIEI